MSQTIKLNLEQIGNRALLQLSFAQGHEDSHQFALPWLEQRDWNAVFWYLTAFGQYPDTWPTGAQTIETAIELQLAAEDKTPLPDRVERIGRQLYQALFGNGSCEQLFRHILNSFAGNTPLVELHFPAASPYLQTYPWELLHDGEDFLFDSLRATLVRYIKFGKPVQPIKLSGSLKVLLVDPRPTMPPEYDELTRSDRATLRSFFAEAGGRLQLEELAPAMTASTFARLAGTLNKSYPADIHVVHIDTHGAFNPKGKANAPQQRSLQGHLAFSDGKNNLVWISGRKLGKALINRGVQLVVLSACSSGTAGAGSAFNSVAGALIRQGIPAVVAMQFPVEETSTRAFIRSFYQTLLNGAPLVQAVAAARTSLLDVDDAWYRPALYLRTDPANMMGRIFETPTTKLVTNRKTNLEDLSEIAGYAGGTEANEIIEQLIEYSRQTHQLEAVLKIIRDWIMAGSRSSAADQQRCVVGLKAFHRLAQVHAARAIRSLQTRDSSQHRLWQSSMRAFGIRAVEFGQERLLFDLIEQWTREGSSSLKKNHVVVDYLIGLYAPPAQTQVQNAIENQLEKWKASKERLLQRLAADVQRRINNAPTVFGEEDNTLGADIDQPIVFGEEDEDHKLDIDPRITFG